MEKIIARLIVLETIVIGIILVILLIIMTIPGYAIIPLVIVALGVLVGLYKLTPQVVYKIRNLKKNEKIK